MRIPLRLSVGLLCALSVAIVAIVTLTVTYRLSLDAIQDLASSHARSLVNIAGIRTEKFFEAMLVAHKGIVESVRRDERKRYILPSKDNRSDWYEKYFDLIYQAQVGGDFTYRMAFSFTDMSTVRGGRAVLPPSPISLWAYFNPYENDENRFYDPTTLERKYYTGLEAQFGSPAQEAVKIKAFLDITQAFDAVYGKDVTLWSAVWFWMVPGVGPYFMKALTHNLYDTDGSYMGYVGTNLDLPQLLHFLQTIDGTPNTYAFAMDSEGLLATTHPAGIVREVRLPANVSQSLASRCTARDANTSSNIFMCRYLPSEVDYAPMKMVASDASFFESTTMELRVVEVDGKRYYAVREPVKCSIQRGWSISIVLFLPEEDLIEKLITGRDASIGITATLFVLSAVVTSLVVHVLLKPVSIIARQMYLTGSLQEDPTYVSVTSITTEISELALSYALMKRQLLLIRGFVPHSLLVGHMFGDTVHFEDDQISMRSSTVPESTVAESETNDNPLDVESAAAPSDAVAINSVSSERGRSNGSGGPSGGEVDSSDQRAVLMQLLPTSVSVSNRRVAVLCFNLRGYNARISSLICDEFVSHTKSLITLVVNETRRFRGVVDFFQGDHIVISYNAVMPTSIPHTHAAAFSAIAIRDRLLKTRGGFGLPCTMGIASGTATVGNVGSSDSKRFNVCGDVMTRASVLERLCKRYSNSINILTTQQEVGEMHWAVHTQYVEIAPIPGLKRRLIAAVMSEVEPPKGNDKDNWMYQQTQSVKHQRHEVDAFSAVNGAFCALFARSIEAAEAEFSFLSGFFSFVLVSCFG